MSYRNTNRRQTSQTSQTSQTRHPVYRHMYIHERVRTYLMDKVLPKLWPSFVHSLRDVEAYPIVLGGVLVKKCAKRSERAKAMLNDLFTEDVDAKIVFRKSVKHLSKAQMDNLVAKIDKVASRVIDQVQVAIERHLKQYATRDLTIKCVFAQTLFEKKHVFELMLEYKETESDRSTSMPLFDLSIVGDNVSHIAKYARLYGKRGDAFPIPYDVHQKVYYATCDYAYYDTVHMLIVRMKYLQDTKNLFALMKLLRYIVKFTAMHILQKDGTVALDPAMAKKYDQIMELLRQVDLAKLTDSQVLMTKYDERYVAAVNQIVKQVVRMTHIEDLMSVMQSSVGPADKVVFSPNST